jgi:LuxR family maltose regulon positive regulatory protein
MAPPTPTVQGNTLIYQQDGQARTLAVGSPEWWAWLARATTFAFQGRHGHFIARKERSSSGRGGWYWRAYHKRGAALRRAYLGKDTALDLDRLEAAATRLASEEPARRPRGARVSPDPAAESAQPRPAERGDAGYKPVVATKLVIPPPRAGLVARTRLVERLAASAPGAVTIICAPAGFGKTTLLAEWLATIRIEARDLRPEDGKQASSLDPQALHVAWVALDPSDNTPATFWTYVAAALERAHPGAGAGALDLLQQPPPPAVEPALGWIVNALAELPNDLILVLDDYHAISAPAIHESVSALIEHLPPRLRLVIASRATPPLRLARLRANGRIAELSAGDLRFTVEEATAFLNQVMLLGLGADDVARLTARTEGWVAGLRLAALALQRHERPADFIATFGGTHRYVFDYLADEVLGRQPQHIQTFLLATSILDRMCGELCDELVGLEARDWRLEEAIETSSKPLASSLILAELEQLNLFVTPLDEERRWYRYHALFADFLRGRLRQLHPEQVPELHRRAAAWFERRGLVEPAIAHALAARDHERAARLVEEQAEAMLARREVAELLDWLRQLPDAVVRSRPRLSLAYAAALLIDGQPHAIEPHLLAAVRSLPPAAHPGYTQSVLGEVAALRAAAATLQGDVARAITLGHQALDVLPADNGLVRGFAAASLGFATLASGDVVRASQTLTDAAALSQASGNAYLTLISLCSLAYLQVAQGQLRRAAETYRRALRQAEQWGGQLLPVAGWAAVGLGELLFEWNDLDAAARTVGEGIERCRQWGSLAPLLVGYATLARIQQVRGDTAGALATIRQARGVQPDLSARLGGLLDALQATLWLRGGDTAAAARWAETCDLRGDWSGFEHGFEHTALARVLIAQGRERADRLMLQEAVWLLSQLRQAASAARWTGRLVRILVLQALVYQALGDTETAVASLGHALALGEPEGYVRTFADEGAPLAALVRLAAARGSAPAYARRLIAAFGSSERAAPATQPLAEPLTERELAVLRGIAAGHTPDEIARSIFLAPTTVKWYLRSIYRKLDVHTRTAAIAAARTLGLVE